jgi:hypothetical protein
MLKPREGMGSIDVRVTGLDARWLPYRQQRCHAVIVQWCWHPVKPGASRNPCLLVSARSGFVNPPSTMQGIEAKRQIRCLLGRPPGKRFRRLEPESSCGGHAEKK